MAIEANKLKGLASVISLAEILVGAYKGGKITTKTVKLALTKLEGRGFRFVPVDRTIADGGAEIRASYGLELPDALIVATCRLNNADCLVTRDEKMYSRVTDLGVSTPEELGYS